uniref:COG complex component COG2 C-terminal domain-containing protein n=1 Tax=Tetradesmus obliquus TaxID=3088 RepID=A0A383VC66_TETOB|eukprot:jgi/Sobl393_1/13795/SZX78914.1
MADGMPGVFSPGNPAAFQANYTAGQDLLAQLEALAASRAAVERLRSSAAAAGWAKRWNLPVYFSLVFQDIAGTFDAAAKASQLQQASPSQHQQQPQLRLAVSAALWAALQRCIAADVFLQALADRFAKLAFQLLVRYDSWLQDVASTRQAALAAPTAAPGTAAGPAAAGAAAPGSPAAGAGAAGGTAAAAGPAGWAGSMGAEECAAICADANALQRLVVGSFSSHLAGLLAGLPGDVVAQLTETLTQLAGNIAQHGQQVLLLIGGDVLERCMAMVRQLKGITATYRMTAKGPPVRHSHYVAGVLQPLRQLLETGGPVQQLPDALKLLLARDVINNVNDRCNALSEELLTTVKKTESSLKRLKKSRPGEDAAAAGAAAAMSMASHGRQIARFGLAAEQLNSFKQLLATVTPPEQQQQQQQELQQQQEQQRGSIAEQP